MDINLTDELTIMRPCYISIKSFRLLTNEPVIPIFPLLFWEINTAAIFVVSAKVQVISLIIVHGSSVI